MDESGFNPDEIRIHVNAPRVCTCRKKNTLLSQQRLQFKGDSSKKTAMIIKGLKESMKCRKVPHFGERDGFYNMHGVIMPPWNHTCSYFVGSEGMKNGIYRNGIARDRMEWN